MNGHRLIHALLWLQLLACGDPNQRLREGFDLLPAAGLRQHLVFADREHHEGFALDLSSDNPRARLERFDLPKNPQLLLPRNAHDELLILCEGQRGSTKEDAATATLAVLTADLDLRAYELGNPFDALRQSEDGRFVLAFKQGATDRLLDNLNEVAIVDLERTPADTQAVTVRTLRSFGDVPQDAVFSPPMRIAGRERRLAVVLSERNVTLIDLGHLGERSRRETTVQLSSEAGVAIKPSQVAFATDDPVLYIRADGSDEVYVFRLAEQQDNAGGNDFRPSINQLAVGTSPRDMALYEANEGPRLLVVAGDSREAVVVEPGTSRATSVPLERAAEHILLYETGGDPRPRTHALLYKPGTTFVSFLGLDDVEERTTRNLDVLQLDLSISRLIPLLDQGVALLIHDTRGVSLLDLASQTVSPISASEVLTDALFETAAQRLWVAPENQPWLGFVDVRTGQTGEVLLDEEIMQVVPLFAIGKLVALHRSDVGHVTVLPTDDPRRQAARSVEGFWLAEVLR